MTKNYSSGVSEQIQGFLNICFCLKTQMKIIEKRGSNFVNFQLKLNEIRIEVLKTETFKCKIFLLKALI